MGLSAVKVSALATSSVRPDLNCPHGDDGPTDRDEPQEEEEPEHVHPSLGAAADTAFDTTGRTNLSSTGFKTYWHAAKATAKLKRNSKENAGIVASFVSDLGLTVGWDWIGVNDAGRDRGVAEGEELVPLTLAAGLLGFVPSDVTGSLVGQGSGTNSKDACFDELAPGAGDESGRGGGKLGCCFGELGNIKADDDFASGASARGAAEQPASNTAHSHSEYRMGNPHVEAPGPVLPRVMIPRCEA